MAKNMDADKAIDLLLADIDGLNEFVMEESARRIERRTPVDTGFARDSIFVEDDGIYFEDDPDKIMALEYGHSDQAPQGMVRRTAAELPQIIEKYMETFPRSTTRRKRKGRM